MVPIPFYWSSESCLLCGRRSIAPRLSATSRAWWALLCLVSEERKMTLWPSNRPSRCHGKKKLITGKMRRGKRSVGTAVIRQKEVQGVCFLCVVFTCGLSPRSQPPAPEHSGERRESEVLAKSWVYCKSFWIAISFSFGRSFSWQDIVLW